MDSAYSRTNTKSQSHHRYQVTVWILFVGMIITIALSSTALALSVEAKNDANNSLSLVPVTVEDGEGDSVQGFIPFVSGDGTAVSSTVTLTAENVFKNVQDIELSQGFRTTDKSSKLQSLLSGNSLSQLFQAVDTEISALRDTLGTSDNTPTLGTFSGSVLISDSYSVKQALQVLADNSGGGGGGGADAQEQSDLRTLTGTATNAQNLGTFTGTTIADSSTVKTALQSLETLVESNQSEATSVRTLTGTSASANDLGTFTGTTIADSSTVKTALQALETTVESNQSETTSVRTLTGTSAAANNLGTFTGTTIADSSTIKTALQALETAVESAGGGGVTFPLEADSGSVSNPSYRFSLDGANSGIYRAGSSSIGFASNGNTQLIVGSTQVKFRDGNINNPSISFINRIDTGFYLSANDGIAMCVDNAQGMSVEANGQIMMGDQNQTLLTSAHVQLDSTAGAFVVNRMTTVQRDALTAAAGMIVYNTTTNQLNYHNGTSWQAL